MIKTINEAIEEGWKYFTLGEDEHKTDGVISFTRLLPIEDAYKYEGNRKMFAASEEGFKPRIPSGKDIAYILAEVVTDMLHSDTNIKDLSLYNEVIKLDLDDVSEKIKERLKYINYQDFPRIELVKTYAHIKNSL